MFIYRHIASGDVFCCDELITDGTCELILECSGRKEAEQYLRSDYGWVRV